MLARRRRGEQLTAALKGLTGVHLPGALHSGEGRASSGDGVDRESIFLRYPVIFDSENMRDAAAQRLNQAGIGAGRMYRKSLATMFADYADGVYPGAEHVACSLLTLPTNHYVGDDDIGRMAEVLADLVQTESERGRSADSQA